MTSGDVIILQMFQFSLWVTPSTCSCKLLCLCHPGHGKTPKDAASVRATHPIPAACGVYYFEVKIISKGRDGYVKDSVFWDHFLLGNVSKSHFCWCGNGLYNSRLGFILALIGVDLALCKSLHLIMPL